MATKRQAAEPVQRKVEKRSNKVTPLSKPLVVTPGKSQGIKNKEAREICDKSNRRRKAVVPPITDDFKRTALKGQDPPPINTSREHIPTNESRLRIAQYIAFGMTIEAIQRLENISQMTLYKYYRWEIEVGQEYINHLVANSLMQQALSGNTTAQIFFHKTRGKGAWQETVRHVHEIESPITDIAHEILLGLPNTETTKS